MATGVQRTQYAGACGQLCNECKAAQAGSGRQVREGHGKKRNVSSIMPCGGFCSVVLRFAGFDSCALGCSRERWRSGVACVLKAHDPEQEPHGKSPKHQAGAALYMSWLQPGDTPAHQHGAKSNP